MCVSPETAPDLSESSPGTDPELLCPEIPWRMGGGLEQIQLAKHRGTHPGLAGTGGCTRRIPVVFWQCWSQQLLPEAHQVRERKGCMFHIPGSSSPRFPGHQDSLHSHLHTGKWLFPGTCPQHSQLQPEQRGGPDSCQRTRQKVTRSIIDLGDLP